MAAALVLTQLRAQLAVPAPGSHPGDPASPDEQPVPGLGVVYFTDHYAAHAQDLLDHLMAALPEVTDWVGTVGVGIAASGVEYFSEPALAVMLLDVPPDQYRVFSGVAPLPAALPSAAGGGFVAATALVHADAGTPDVAELVAELAQRTATGQVFGGLSSASLGRTVQLAHSSRGALPGKGAAGGVFEGGLSGVAFGEGVALLSRVVWRIRYLRRGSSGASESQQSMASNCLVTVGSSPVLTIMSPREMSISSSSRMAIDCSA